MLIEKAEKGRNAGNSRKQVQLTDDERDHDKGQSLCNKKRARGDKVVYS